MKKKRLIAGILAAGMVIGSAFSASAYSVNMYVGNKHLVRDMQTRGRFDMLPIMDIAGELGYQVYYENGKFWLFNDKVSYEFTVGKASFYDQDGNWYGLDVVPQFINGKLRLPYSFFKQINVSYNNKWDTVFIGSDYTYNWLINTDSYRATSGRLSNGAPINVDYVREGCMGWQEAAKYAVQYAKNHSWYGYCPWNESSYYIEYFAENDNYYLIGINSSTEDIYNGRHFFSGAWTNYKVNNRTGKVTAFGGGPQGWESSDKNKEFYYYWSDLAKSLF